MRIKEANEDDQLIRRFLLGDVSEEERQRVEESFITDSVYSESVLMAENDLIEDYLEGDLPQAEKEQFDAHFLSTPRQRRKVRIAESLKKFAVAEAAAPSPATGEGRMPRQPQQRTSSNVLTLRKPLVILSLAAVLLIALGLGAWKIVGIRRENERREQAQTRRAAIEQELAQLNVRPGGTPSDARIFSTDLSPVVVRSSANSGMISPPAQTTVVELRLVLIGEEYQNYRASLQKFDSTDQFTIPGLRAESATGGKVVPVKIPARLLTRGIYQLRLRGDNGTGEPVEVGEYQFQLTNQAAR
ncbi:MAG TPA: hypothetical protein VGO96_12460 [Pyrinomonadaceae bacterium]|jgi:hypothetical protein|nr:hypothetical protein [Pyrinomonadaceae bacterium]